MSTSETIDDARPPDVRLLVIEPENSLRATLEANLAKHWVTNVAASATTGLATASWFRPTVVVLDMFDAGLGASAFATLLRYGRTDTVFLIGTTSHDQAARARSVRGVDVVLFKPVDMEQLVRVIAQRAGMTHA